MADSNQQLNEAFDQSHPRYVVGIDLGTTNSAVSFIDSAASDEQRRVQTFSIPQRVELSSIDRLDTLPSFLYQLTDAEGEVTGPWLIRDQNRIAVVGSFARNRGTQMPGRQTSSAKSWLSHRGVDRHDAFLPWNAEDDVKLVSPVDASAAYLNHIRTAWNQQFQSDPLEDQDVVLTLPASFDEVARELTVEAARRAGLPRIALLEEPQAAFYAWLHRNASSWSTCIQPGQTILVCDIGGGTTDFTLIRVRENARNSATTDPSPDSIHASNRLSLQRVSVGQHLILGGDNLDLALAKAAESQLSEEGHQLSARQWDSLRLACRKAKENLLAHEQNQPFTINLPGVGSSLLAKSLQVSITPEMIRKVLLDGFFPEVRITDRSQQSNAGFQEFGLPYANDPAVTRHLAEFLWNNRWVQRSDQMSPSTSSEVDSIGDLTDPNAIDPTELRAARPDFVLFNGGVLEASAIRQRLTAQINHWFSSTETTNPESESTWNIEVLENPRLDLAVAQGAAYFGLVRRGEGVKIDSRSPRGFYLEVSTDPPRAMCLMPAGVEPGEQFIVKDQTFELATGIPVRFPLWVSSLRPEDQPGDVVELDRQELRPLANIQSMLELERSRKQATIPVHIKIRLTEIGTLETYLEQIDHSSRWKIDFDTRAQHETSSSNSNVQASMTVDRSAVNSETAEKVSDIIRSVFSDPPDRKPKELMRALAESIGLPKDEWSISLLRTIWTQLMEVAAYRSISAAHESRWLNLLGFCLRPGFGYAADDWRVTSTWRSVNGKIKHASATIAQETTVMWRRISGGFTAGQQFAVYQANQARIQQAVRTTKSGGSMSLGDAAEMIRLAGSLELLPIDIKLDFLAKCRGAIRGKKTHQNASAVLWAIGRVANRDPIYGPLHLVPSSEHATQTVEDLLHHEIDLPEWSFALMQVARKTGDRYRDIPMDLSEQVIAKLTMRNVDSEKIRSIREPQLRSSADQADALGDSMPLGLSLH